MPRPEPIAYLNGRLLPFREALLPVFDLGIVQGATLSERLRTFAHRPFQVREHLERLQRGVQAAGWGASIVVDDLAQPLHQVAEHNARQIRSGDDLAVVLFVTGGPHLPDSNGLAEQQAPLTVCIYTAPLPLAQYARWYENGVALAIPSVRHIPSQSLDPHLKTRSRMHWYLAEREVRARQPDSWALLLDHAGFVTETSSGNLFVVQGRQLLTPLADTTLCGTAQNLVIELGQQLGLAVGRRNLCAADVASADEAFLTSSTYCIAPVTSLDGTLIGTGEPGTVTRDLLHAWSDAVRVDIVGQARKASQSLP